MKKIYTNIFLGLLIVLSGIGNTFAQAPQGINYQAVARDASGAPLANANISLRFSIYNAIGPDTVWIEAHNTNTNSFGLFTAVIGLGTKIGGSKNFFSEIKWGAGSYYLRVRVNGNDMGVTQFFSVPYSLYANSSQHAYTADSVTFPITGMGIWKKSGGSVFLNTLSDNVGIGNPAPLAKLDVLGTVQISDNTTINGYVTSMQNNIASSGQSGGVLNIINSGSRSIDNNAVFIQNLTTKTGGSGTAKTGLKIESTGPWAPSTGQPNIGLFVDATGADINYAAIFAQGRVGIGTPNPKNTVSISGSMAWKLTTVPTSYTITPTTQPDGTTVRDCIVEISASGIITLPPSSAVDKGTVLVIRNRFAGNITVAAQSGDMIQLTGGGTNASSAIVSSYGALRLYLSGAIWLEW